MTLHYLEGHLYIEIYMPQNCMEKFSSGDLLEKYREAIRDIPEIVSIVVHLMPK